MTLGHVRFLLVISENSGCEDLSLFIVSAVINHLSILRVPQYRRIQAE